MIKLNKQDYLAPAEYSQKKGISQDLVRRYCRNGRLKAIKVSNRWFIPIDSYPKDYTPRIREGLYIGLSELKKGNVEGFLKKRGIIPE